MADKSGYTSYLAKKGLKGVSRTPAKKRKSKSTASKKKSSEIDKYLRSLTGNPHKKGY